MSPVAYRPEKNRTGLTAGTDYDCPNCPGTVRREGQSMRCPDCGHVPRHGAD